MVSIIIPVYNVENYIEVTLRSLLNQTYNDYELILVDDGSSDNSMSVAENVLKDNSFSNYIMLREENSGQGEARNYGMSVARGEWLFFMDSDDILPSYALAKLIETAEKKNADMTFCDFKFSTGDLIEEDISKCCANTYNSQNIQFDFLTRKKKIIVPGTVYRTKWLKENDLKFPKLRFSEDVYFLWEALGKVDKVVEVEACLYTYVIRESSTMNASKKYKLIDAYKEYQVLDEGFQKNPNIIQEVKQWMLPRWVFGVLRTAARLMPWSEYVKFADEISYEKWCKKLKDFPDYKIKVLSRIALTNLKLYYSLFSRML